MPDPKIGEMVLYDYIRPALLAGEYRMRVSTDVTISGTPQPLPGEDFFFDVEGPRFALAPSEVAGVFPPRGGHGPFDSALPHVALGRRTLPWERALGDAYTAGPGETPYPFLALVLLETAECTLKRNMPLTDIVPADVYQRLGRPQGVRCDAVEADADLLHAILPMPDELRLLTHVRQVNVDDRELAAGDSDGYFAVVMGNRIPAAGKAYTACLVSVEERTDLLPTVDAPEIFTGIEVVDEVPRVYEAAASSLGTSVTPKDADRVLRGGTASSAFVAGLGGTGTQHGSAVAAFAGTTSSSVSTSAGTAALEVGTVQQVGRTSVTTRAAAAGWAILHPPARLVLLHSWTFQCEGDGTFRQLMQGLDVGMAGDVDPATKLQVTDTGHIAIDVVDRLGAPEQSWYRGPFAPQPVSRDPLGPYHSADQARRVVAETGAENISYASAFEVGRLLAAADARLAQELMRWRRTAFRSSARQTSVSLLAQAMGLVAITDPLDPVAIRYAVDVLQKVTAGVGPLGDPLARGATLAMPLLQPESVQKAFGLQSVDQAHALLGVDAALAAAVAPTAARAVGPTTLDAVLKDAAGLAALGAVRANAIAAVQVSAQAAGAQTKGAQG